MKLQQNLLIWCALAIGGRRDFDLALRLSASRPSTNLKLKDALSLDWGLFQATEKKYSTADCQKTGGGAVIETNLPDLRDKPYFDAKRFHPTCSWNLTQKLSLDGKTSCGRQGVCRFRGVQEPATLDQAQFQRQRRPLRAALVRPSDKEWGVICKKTYVSVRDLSPDGSNIQTACFAYNSQLATYFSAITSSRMGHYITELLADELLDVPLPLNPISNLADFDSFAQIDAEARRVFTLTQADWTLVEDFLSITLPDALRKRPGAGHHITARTPSKREFQTEVVNYARFFSRVVKAHSAKPTMYALRFLKSPHIVLASLSV